MMVGILAIFVFTGWEKTGEETRAVKKTSFLTGF